MTLYEAYFPMITKAVTSLNTILTKAEAHAKENGTNVDTEYFSASIHSDMKPLPFQVLIVASMVKAVAIPVTGVTPDWPSEDKTFADLLARAKLTQELLQTIKPEDVNEKADEEFEFAIGAGRRSVLKKFVTDVVVPNVFFHLVTAYDILRKQDVPLGKMDYIGPFLA